MSIPKACQGLADEVEAAEQVLMRIQSSPNYIEHDGPRPGKPNPAMLMEAEQQEAKIRELTGQFNTCLRDHGVEPTEVCSFTGTAELDSSLGSGHHHFAITLEFFQPHHRRFNVQEFPPLQVNAGGHTVTITQIGGGNGTFDPASGKLELPIDLKVDAPSPGGHMNLPITLSTENHSGKRMDSHGKMTITGKGTGHGSGIGFPDSIEVTMVGAGAVSPRP
jgi:hypothetical protein